MTKEEEITYIKEYMMHDSLGDNIKFRVAYFVYLVGKVIKFNK